MKHTTATRLNAVLSTALFLVLVSVSFSEKNPVAPATFLAAIVFGIISFEVVCQAIDDL